MSASRQRDRVILVILALVQILGRCGCPFRWGMLRHRAGAHRTIELARLNLQPGREHPLFICARQRDQSKEWTSALFLTLA